MNPWARWIGLFILGVGLAGCGPANDNPTSRSAVLKEDVEMLWHDFISYHADPIHSVVIAQAGPAAITADEIREFVGSSPAVRSQWANPKNREDLIHIMIQHQMMTFAANQMTPIPRDADFHRDLQSFIEAQKGQRFFLVMKKGVWAASDAEVQSRLDAHKERSLPSKRINSSVIVLNTLKDAMLAKKLLAQKIPFEDVAKRLSIDHESAQSGGTLPAFQLEDMPPEIQQALKPLHNGQISPIIQSDGQFKILKKDSEIIINPLPPELLRLKIAGEIQNEKRIAWINSYMTNHHFQVTMDSKALDALDLNP